MGSAVTKGEEAIIGEIDYGVPLNRAARHTMKRLLFSCALILVFLLRTIVECGAKDKESFELRGTVLQQDGRAFAGQNAYVQLSIPLGTPALATLLGSDGKFKFKKIPAGIYVLTAVAPRVARARRTVEVGPSLADQKGRIEVTVRMEPRSPRSAMFLVPATQLSIPDRAREELEEGQQCLNRRDLSGAIEHFQRATKLAPHFSAAWFRLGRVAYHQGRYQDSANLVREALRHSPDDYQALVYLGAVLLASRDITEALAVNKRAVLARPDDAQAQAQCGLSCLLVDRLEEAEEHLKKAKLLDPANFYYPQLLLADIYRRRNDYSSMARELEEFLRLHPDSPKAREIAPLLARARRTGD